ncbi:MAG: dihydroorotate dehydrogenase [Acidobacteria bacterium]|nr:dihydroorotate dehydrogenase [Acidobacteriota bacterium]
MDLRTRVGPLVLANPVMTASGTFGYGLEFEPYLDLSRLGAVVVKGLSLEPRPGNPSPRIWETAAGMLNAIGLQNVGVETFLRDKLPPLRRFNVPVIANALGNSVEEYAEVCGLLASADGIAAVELNISCPNVKAGGIHFAGDPAQTAKVTAAARKAMGSKPLIVKLSPNVTDIAPFARACKDEGADAVSLVNTFVGMAIDVETLRPRLANVIGGLSGPAIKPLAQRMVWEVCRKVDIPVIAIGGIMTGVDAAEYLALGARAVQVGTASYVRPDAAVQVLDELAAWGDAHGYVSTDALSGAFLRASEPRT